MSSYSETTPRELDQFLDGENAKLKQTHLSALVAKFGPIRKEIEAVEQELLQCSTHLCDLLDSLRDKLDPDWKLFNFSRNDLSDLAFFKFVQTVGGVFITQLEQSARRTSQMGLQGTTLLSAFREGASVGQVIQASQAGAEFLNLAQEEFTETYVGFDKLLGNVYLATKAEYKRLRRKFLGEISKQDPSDDFEENLLSQFFGSRPKPPDVPLGPATALVDDNCVLTQVLSDLADALPKEYERTVPIMKRGVPTGKTKTIHETDPGEIEEYSRLLASASNPTYARYILAPDLLLSTILGALKLFYQRYSPLAQPLEKLVARAAPHLPYQKQMRQRGMLNPRAIEKPYGRINFLAIRPAAEDVAPRTRVERDFAEAREELFRHLMETWKSLQGMEDRFSDTAEKYALVRVTEAIQLRKKMDEVMKSEQQKSLARNIRDDNEFYVGRNGQLGNIELEREAAPSTTYADVVGDSFVRAKEHIEEVVKVASHPHVMRLSAPRGDVRSNVMLIGPYGCGKSFLAKAICADKRIIGVNISAADLLTAYMHESVKNIKRLYERCKDLRRKSRYSKPVGIVLDEFDRLFTYGEGVHAAYDGDRMTGTLQEMMDGVIGYEGVFLVGMTNVPKQVPEAILRRFKFVDVVGNLNTEERATLFEKFLAKMPLDAGVGQREFDIWARMLEYAPGDVIGKVADEIHFKYMSEFVEKDPKKMAATERKLGLRIMNREATKADRQFLKKALASHRSITAEEITAALDNVLKQPQVTMQINKAKEVYRYAKDILDGLSRVGSSGLGFNADRKSKLW